MITPASSDAPRVRDSRTPIPLEWPTWYKVWETCDWNTTGAAAFLDLAEDNGWWVFKIINREDPDPVAICQLFEAMAYADNRIGATEYCEIVQKMDDVGIDYQSICFSHPSTDYFDAETSKLLEGVT